MSTKSSSSARDRLVTLATVAMLGLAVAQGGFVAYRLATPSTARTAGATLPPDTKDFRGKPLPALTSLNGLNGAAIKNETAAPVTIVALVRTTCAACNLAKPTLEALKSKYGDQVGVVAVFAEDRATVQAYGATYPTFVDAQGSVFEAFDVKSVPQFLVVRDGKVVDQKVGYSPEIGQELEAVAKGVM